MAKYICFFYETVSGKMPVEDFINSLDGNTYDKFIFKKELLEQLGPQLRFPHTDYIADGISELRFKGSKGQIRVLFFFFHKNQIILLPGFIKKTQKTPNKEVKTARQRKKDILQRRKKS